MKEEIRTILDSFESISLEEISSVSLMKRTDTKFVLHINDLKKVLKELVKYYEILEINNKRLLSYKSQYFDTSNRKFYHDHHNGKLRRTKIRIRQYLESGDAYLEIKEKSSKGTLKKTRMPIEGFKSDLNNENHKFITGVTNKHFELENTLTNSFDRTTLANRATKERVTIDLNLCFNYKTYNAEFEDVVIIELKQERLDRNSDLFQVLKKLQINPYRISKYCIGMASLDSTVKHNRFKTKIIKLKKINSNGVS